MAVDNSAFIQLLSSELELTSALQSLLKQELVALSEQRLESLTSLQQQKSQLLQQLQQQSVKRLDWMTKHQLPHTSQCIQRPEFAVDPSLCRLWWQLAASYESNQKQSHVLAEVVLTARKRTIDCLNILRGKQNDPHLYNASGKTSGLNSGLGYTQA